MVAFLFEDIYEKFSKTIPQIKSSLGMTDIDELWFGLLESNKNKDISQDEETKYIQLSRMYIVEFCFFLISIDNEKNKFKLCSMFQSFLLNIVNTSFAIYKLAFDGFDYQSKVLLRNLYEICLTFLIIVIDSEKRILLFESMKKDNATEIWYKHFKPSKMQKVLIDFEEKYGSNYGAEWLKSAYQSLSSYVHNDYMYLFMYSRAAISDDNTTVNLCGNYATRVDPLLHEMNLILFYTGLIFLKAFTCSDISKEQLCGEDDSNINAWNKAISLELINRECFLDIIKEKEKTTEE